MGGPSGAVSFPVYLEGEHAYMMRGSVPGGSGGTLLINNSNALINVAQGAGGNPYEGETAFDPDAALTLTSGSPLDKMSDQFDVLSTMVDVLNSAGYFSTYPTVDVLTTLAANVGTIMTAIGTALGSADVTAMVTAFENNKKPRFLREISAWTAGMADVNAVNTSSFVIGMALRQKDFADAVDHFEAGLKVDIMKGVLDNTLASHLKGHLLTFAGKADLFARGPSIYSDLAKLKADIEKLIILAKVDQHETQMKMDVEEGLWDFEVMMYGVNVLSAINGAPAGRKTSTSKGQAALAGAAVGASIGAMLPGPLALPGVLIGAAVGGAAGYMSAGGGSWPGGAAGYFLS